MPPLVSIIIPAFNRAHCIGDAIKSVQNQTLWKSGRADYEIIVVDDASTDNTQEVLSEIKKFDPRLRVIKHDQNKGVSAARNTGIKKAGGLYVAFLDSDDAWDKNKLSAQLDMLENAPYPREDIFVFSYFVGKTKQGKFSVGSIWNFLANMERDKNGNFINFRTFPEKILERETISGGIWLGCGSTLFAHREAIRKNGFFLEDLKCGEDIEYIARFVLRKGGHLRVVPRLLMTYSLPETGKYSDMGKYSKYMIERYGAAVEERFGSEAKADFVKRLSGLVADKPIMVEENDSLVGMPVRTKTSFPDNIRESSRKGLAPETL